MALPLRQSDRSVLLLVGSGQLQESRAKAEDSRTVQRWLADSDKLALSRLARHWAISQAEAVARLVRQADKAVMDGMDDDQFEEYLA